MKRQFMMWMSAAMLTAALMAPASARVPAPSRPGNGYGSRQQIRQVQPRSQYGPYSNQYTSPYSSRNQYQQDRYVGDQHDRGWTRDDHRDHHNDLRDRDHRRPRVDYGRDRRQNRRNDRHEDHRGRDRRH